MYMGKSNFSGLAKIYIRVYDIIIIIFFSYSPLVEGRTRANYKYTRAHSVSENCCSSR